MAPGEMITVLSVCTNPIFTMAACCGEWAAPGSQARSQVASYWRNKRRRGFGFYVSVFCLFPVGCLKIVHPCAFLMAAPCAVWRGLTALLRC